MALGELLATRREPGDAEEALALIERVPETPETREDPLPEENPASAETEQPLLVEDDAADRNIPPQRIVEHDETQPAPQP